MAKIQAVEKNRNEADELMPSLHGRAMDNLQFIRRTMEQATHFTAVPGYGGVFMGLTAVGASFIASEQPNVKGWLTVWLVEALLGFAIGLFAMWQKSKIANTALTSPPAKKFAISFLPPIVCALIITIGLWRLNYFGAMIPVWIMLYGAAVVTGGSVSVRVVPIMGWCFIALGAIDFFLPAEFGNSMMALSFGALHIVFGVIIARRFGG